MRRALEKIKILPSAPLYDALLIDEAQDFPTSFFELAFLSTREPKRITWAYDELQNLGRYSMAPPSELFGVDAQGNPNIAELRNLPGQARQDLVLPVCYRNTPWALTTAHAAGFGIYRSRRLVQFFSDPDLWEAVGYRVIQGELRPGSHVSLERRQDASPDYFRRLLQPEDAVNWEAFDTRAEQIRRTAELIGLNLAQDELLPNDILVILANPVTARTDSADLMEALGERGIGAHLAGVTSSRDQLFVEGSVAVSGIHRAKGNEAPMVYLLDADYCFDGLDLIRRRNILFTAITRSRAWVRVFGCGTEMRKLADELNLVRENCYRLNFDIPLAEELERLRQIHRDRSAGEEEKVRRLEAGVAELLEKLERGELARENLDPDLLARIESLLAPRS
jgi:superfamily I DNA and RNA helicase